MVILTFVMFSLFISEHAVLKKQSHSTIKN